MGIDSQRPPGALTEPTSWERQELQRLKRQVAEASFEQGTRVDAWARALLYLGDKARVVDERPYNLMQRMVAEMRPDRAPTAAELKAAIKRQAYLLALDEERAIEALPRLASTRMDERRRGLAAARKVIGARGKPSAYQEERLRRLAHILGLDKPARARRSA